ncbi:ABC transporter ATP-binding protein [Kitasatospora sp. MAP5-34]|uniref:ABC transporter ATP-binding protein n=1 Tax=Kitasatospora sp. MAP5-34 TaxID=3035102 RepID=UPI002474DFA1|nr:ABC transporter ATP-binding protein [Kitasatospora sp. MAP5-34]MDH6574527.1 peptide/nickel transport system ATP-binding protein [Kitasatospora sp. MAP5-34]
MKLLEVADLRVAFDGVAAVDGLSFDLGAGESLGLVGESGSGKSTVALALLGLHRGSGAEVTGAVRVDGTDVLAATEAGLRALRGARAAMVFQDPLSALDPYWAIGDQIAEVHRVHTGSSRRAAHERAVQVLDRVGIPDAARRAKSHPHEFSGGMRQRALIAMALACSPKLLIADEPTTALDVTVQAQILDLLHELRAEDGMALLLVTHDLGVVAGNTDRVLVMRDGRAVERGEVAEVLGAPREPYTRELLAAVPRLDSPRERPDGPKDVLLSVTDLHRHYPAPAGGTAGWRGLLGARAKLRAVDGVSLDIRRGETLGVVGESGSGKSTLGRLLVRLAEPTSGEIRFEGEDLARASERRLRPLRRDLQMVFQDPVSSLNPRRTIGESVADPLRVHGRSGQQLKAEVGELLDRVGLRPDWYQRYPHELSGGQRQRVGIARALALRPKLIVCDEPVSALDVTTQAQVIRLLADLQAEFGLTLVFIAHDLAVVRQVSDRVAVLRHGRIVELGTVDEVYESPQHPYTRGLLAAVPVLDPAEADSRRAARAELRGRERAAALTA